MGSMLHGVRSRRLSGPRMSVTLVMAMATIGVLFIAACGSGAESAENGGSGLSSAGEKITIVDDGGREVTIPTEIERVFCTSSVGTYLVYTLAPERLVGWNTTPTELEQAYIPEEYRPTVGLGGWYGKNTTGNVEEIIKAAPDVVFSVGDMESENISDADRVQELLDIPVVLVGLTLTTTGDTYRFIGELLGEEQRAAELASYSDEVIARAEAIAAQIPEEQRATIYYAEGAKGLYTEPEGSTHTEVFAVAATHNVADMDIQEGYGMSPVSLEQVIAWDPDFIFVESDPAGEMNVHGHITESGDWSILQAVKAGQVYQIPHGPFDWLDRPNSVARILGVQWVGDLVYPDLWDLDIKEATQEFYRLFFHYELSDKQYQELTIEALASD